MQTLGVSDSLPSGEGRLKSLFWPSIRSGSDVEYLSIQGYWVCTIVAVLALLGTLSSRAAFLGLLLLLFFHLGGVGVRQGSQFAAAMVFAVYGLDTIQFLSALFTRGGALLMVMSPFYTMGLVLSLRFC